MYSSFLIEKKNQPCFWLLKEISYYSEAKRMIGITKDGQEVEIAGVHPVAALSPQLEGDDFDELVESIQAHGQKQPVVLDGEGLIIDGRNRARACERLGVTPRVETYVGDDPDVYALVVNVDRRSLTKGQKAAWTVAARSLLLSNKNLETELAEQAGVSQAFVAKANTVREYRPDLLPDVIAGTTALNDAYEQAREAKKTRELAAWRIGQVRAHASDLAERVDAGALAPEEAWTLLEQRQLAAEEKRRVAEAEVEKERAHEEEQRARATALVDGRVNALLDLVNLPTAGDQYDPEQSVHLVTRGKLQTAREIIEQLTETWEKRGLP